MRNQTENRRRRKKGNARRIICWRAWRSSSCCWRWDSPLQKNSGKTEEANLPLTSGITEAPTAGETRIKMPPRTAGTLFLVNANFGLDPAYQPGKIVQVSEESARRGISSRSSTTASAFRDFFFRMRPSFTPTQRRTETGNALSPADTGT